MRLRSGNQNPLAGERLYSNHGATHCSVADRRSFKPLVNVRRSRRDGHRRSLQLWSLARSVVNCGISHDIRSNEVSRWAPRSCHRAGDGKWGMFSDFQVSDSNAAIWCGNRTALRGMSRTARRRNGTHRLRQEIPGERQQAAEIVSWARRVKRGLWSTCLMKTGCIDE
jgi:hypothetical protein